MKTVTSLALAVALCLYSPVSLGRARPVEYPDHRTERGTPTEIDEDVAVTTVILVTCGVITAAGVIVAWFGGGQDPAAETYAWAYAGDWCCGDKGSESDEAHLPDVSAESTAGEYRCEDGAKAKAHVKAFWVQTDADTLAGKVEKGPCYGWAPSSCYGKYEARAELKGTTKWEVESPRSSGEPLHMQLYGF